MFCNIQLAYGMCEHNRILCFISNAESLGETSDCVNRMLHICHFSAFLINVIA